MSAACIAAHSISHDACRYGSKLAAHASVEHHTLQHLYAQTSMPPLVSRVTYGRNMCLWLCCLTHDMLQVLVDTSGCGFEESQSKVPWSCLRAPGLDLLCFINFALMLFQFHIVSGGQQSKRRRSSSGSRSGNIISHAFTIAFARTL
jgi:hypothetical protein